MSRTMNDVAHDAEMHGWKVTACAPKVLKLMNDIAAKTGVPFCPCKPKEKGVIVIVDGKKVYKTQCPCVDASKEIKEKGHCCCNMYEKKE